MIQDQDKNLAGYKGVAGIFHHNGKSFIAMADTVEALESVLKPVFGDDWKIKPELTQNAVIISASQLPLSP